MVLHLAGGDSMKEILKLATKKWLKYFVPGFGTSTILCVVFGEVGRNVWISWGLVAVSAWMLCMCIQLEPKRGN